MRRYERAGERVLIGLSFALMAGTIVGLLMLIGVID